MKTICTLVKVLLISLVLVSAAAFAEGKKMSEEDRKRNQDNRARISQEKIDDAILLFFGAVAKFAQDEVASQIIDIDGLSTTLESSMGILDQHMGKAESAGGQFNTTDEGVNAQMDAKNARLDKAVSDAKKRLETERAVVHKYSNCSGNKRSFIYRGCHSKYTAAKRAARAAEHQLRRAQKARDAYGSKEQYNDSKSKEPAMDAAKSMDKNAEGPRFKSLENGERLYSAQEKLNAHIRDASKTAIEVAGEAKLIALRLIGGTANDDFETSQGMEENRSSTGKIDKGTEMDLLKRVSKENAAHKYINLFALSGGASEYFMCDNVSDTECVSYHLMVAANAIYLALQIRETSDYNANTKDIFDTDEDPENKYDDQYKLLQRAAKIREEALRTADQRMKSQVLLKKMLFEVNNIAQIENLSKKTRVTAAKSQVRKAKKNKKKIENSLKMSAAMIVLELGWTQLCKAISISGWACCNPLTSGCCVIGTTYAKFSLYWYAKMTISVALNAYYVSELIKAKAELRRAMTELALAGKHTHMRCRKDKSIDKQAYSAPFIDNALYIARLFTQKLIPYAYAGADSSALGTLDEAGIFKYYEIRKDEESDLMVERYPTPETRAEYMQEMALKMVDDSMLGTQDILDDLKLHVDEYNAVVNNMDASAQVNEHGQVSGETDPKDPGSVEKISLSGSNINAGASDFGNLSDYDAKQRKGSDDKTESLKSDGTASAGIQDVATGNRKAANLLKKVDDQANKAKSLLDKAKLKRTSDNSSLWQDHNKAVLKKFSDKNPKHKGFSSSAVANLAKSSAVKKNAKVSGDSKKKADLTAVAGSAIGDKKKAFDPTAGMSFNFDDDTAADLNQMYGDSQCTPEQYKASPSSCAEDPDTMVGREALGYLKNQLHRYKSDNEGDENGVYDGKDSLFGLISKRYIKTALPIFFTAKPKKE